MATTGILQRAPAPAPCPTGDSRPATGHTHNRHKPRKFSMFVKRLMKSSSSSSSSSSSGPARNEKPSTSLTTTSITSGAHRSASFSHNQPRNTYPYAPQSLSRSSSNGHLSFAPHQTHSSLCSSTLSSTSSFSSIPITGDATHDSTSPPHSPTLASSKSRPPPSATTATSYASRFSSPSHSTHSLTTTLTTLHSTAPGSILYNPHPSHHHNPNAPPVMYSTPFPANPMLLHPTPDDASIMTLASSSKRRRRHSADTDASVRALPPSSVWGGSRESLPLSLLSGGTRNGERGSLYGYAQSVNGVGVITEVAGGGSGQSSVAAGSAIVRSGGHSRGPSALGIEFGVGAAGCAGPGAGAGPGGGASHSPLNTMQTRAPPPITHPNTDTQTETGTELDQHEEEHEEEQRRSWSIRSASLRGEHDEHDDRDGEREDVASVRDGSSNIGVWNGVVGRVRERERERKRERREREKEREREGTC